jgi:hypothetical protein
MKTFKALILGSAAGMLAVGGAQAADLPMKAKAVEYVKICSLYGAGFYYIPGTDTCMRIGGAIRLDTTFGGGLYDAPNWQGGAGGAVAYGQNTFSDRARFNFTSDTRTATEYGVLRTFANLQIDWTGQGTSGIAGGSAVETDFAFIQFAGFTFGKAVSEYDPTWALLKPTISSAVFSGSNNATGILQAAYTASFGNGVSGTISLEDAQPYRVAGIINTSNLASQFIGPFGTVSGAGSLAGAFGTSSFPGNAVSGDHVPDIVGNLRLDQAWGSLHFAAAAHENHGNFYTNNFEDLGHPGAVWGGAVMGAIEFKNLPTGAGDTFRAEAGYGHGAAKYVMAGTIDSAGAGRFARLGSSNIAGDRGSMAFGYVLDGVYTGTNSANGSGINLSNAYEVTAWYEHYWNPLWRTSLFANYSHIDYGSAGDAALMAMFKSAGPAPGAACAAAACGTTTGGLTASTTGSFSFATFQIGSRTAWTPVKDLTISGEVIYTQLYQNLNGTFVSSTSGTPSGAPSGSSYEMKNQGLWTGAIQMLRSF